MYKKYEEVASVKLFAHSMPMQEQIEGIEDVQDLIAYCAKVSNPSQQLDFSKSERLLNYLIKHKHWSPFEMADAVLEITTTRDIARQILRHRSFSFQEFSQRYADTGDQTDQFVLREARLQDAKNRQNSIEVDDKELQEWWYATQVELILNTKRAYDEALKRGIAKEQARVLLPEGNTVSRVYMKGSLRSWIHYCELRRGNGTQKEHMMIADACAEAIAQIFPYIKGTDEEKVTINKDYFDLLERDSKILSHLEELGVDNWDGYSIPDNLS